MAGGERKKGRGGTEGSEVRTQKLTNIQVLHYFVSCVLPPSQVHLVTVNSTRFTGMLAK